MTTTTKHQSVKTQAQGSVALYHLTPHKSDKQPVIITHGTLSTVEAIDQLAESLLALDFDYWLLEWGGHGNSQVSSPKQDFEFAALHETAAAVDYVLAHNAHSALHWVAHSGGGHLALMYLARYENCRDKISALVAIGTQATDGALGVKHQLRAISLWAVTKLLHRTPSWLAGQGDESEPSLLLAQWARWNLSGRWHGHDGFDYLAKLDQLTLPCLIIAGSHDVIAPISGCQKIYQQLASQQKEMIICSKADGFSRDFSHGQLVRGRAARQEIFPKIQHWLSHL